MDTYGNPTAARLEYLRGELRGERISMSELVELQGMADDIDPHDVELLEAAGVSEEEAAARQYVAFKEGLQREARSLRVPMTHLPKDEEYMPVLAYRVDQEIAAAERRIAALKLLRDRYTA